MRKSMRTAVAWVTAAVLAGGAGSAGAGQLTGTVTNELTGVGVSGVTVVLDPPVAGTIVTASGGTYSVPVPPGTYEVSFEDVRFEPSAQAGVVIPAVGTVVADAVLTPVAPVIVTITRSADPEPEAEFTVHAEVEILDGSIYQSIAWTEDEVLPVELANANTTTVTVTLPDLSAYKDELLRVLAEPPIGPDQLPPNVPPPPDEFAGGLQDRFQVVGVNPFALEEAGLVTLQAVVTTTSGTHPHPVELHTALPFKRAGAIRNVPLGIPVLLHGKAAPEGVPPVYDWTLTRPGGSSAALVDAATRDPWFVPDVTGKYTVFATDPGSGDDVSLEIWAGPWEGVITGQDGAGHPEAEDCTFCHDGTIAPDKFTPWAETGHAEIFSTLLDTSTYYSPSCFGCHSVGYDPDVENDGFDDALDFPAFLAAGLLGVPGDNWSTMLANHPDSARRANVQCESCHGPFQSDAHGRNTPSITLAADNCATCHGEPVRHGRFQQWQLSGHANYELAIEEGTNGNCARCHTANGFLEWVPVLLDDDPNTDPLANIQVTWTEDDTHPQTCVACHDPHMAGTTSGNDTDATVRISGDTPPLVAGFTATNVGKGAICMTCHNTRRGLRNEGNFPEIAGTSEMTRAPHPGAQADVLMGENVYLVDVGARSPHAGAGVEDTCVDCHMQATPPPAELSYEQSGTNHTFYASPEICAECHDTIVAEDVQEPVEAGLADLQGRIESKILAVMAQQFALGRTVTVGDVALASTGDFTDLTLADAQGRLAISVELAGGETAGPTGLNSVSVKEGETSVAVLWELLDERLFKAGWNWAVLEADGSRGVHNAAFANDVLTASIDAVNAVPEPGAAASLGAAVAAFAALARARRRARR